MFLQGLLTALVLPPLLLALAGIAGGLLAWRGRRPWGGAVAALACFALLLLATPFAAGTLMASLEAGLTMPVPGTPVAGSSGARPGAIIILGAETVRNREGRADIGPLTLERLRAGAALHRRTGLPVLVTGGPPSLGGPSLAELMARSLALDFGAEARWMESRARDTRENAAFGAAMLREGGIGAAFVVTHGWHMPRALEAFARQDFPAVAAPLRLREVPEIGNPSNWVPRADHLGASWFALREWAGRLVYAVRDGRSARPR